jgi:hypothetical protein
VTEAGGVSRKNVGQMFFRRAAMLRTASIAILILAGSALGAVLLCALTLRILLSAAFALSGIRPRMSHSTQVLDW